MQIRKVIERYKIRRLSEWEAKKRRKAAVNRLKEAIVKKERVVVVWGAGASAPSGIPTGKYIRQRTVDYLKHILQTDIARKELGSDYNRIRKEVTEDEGLSFEYVLGVYAKIHKDGLHEWLTQFIPERVAGSPPYFPTFAYEFAAHLAKVGVFKHFITTNFDELFEFSLQNELGSPHLQVLASRSDFQHLKGKPLDQWDAEYGIIKPQCYVFKPHGTISRPLTLRHLPELVKVLDDEKSDVLSTVLKGALVLFAGFGNYNEDFWLLFGQTYARGLTGDIIIVSFEPDEIAARLPGARHIKEIHQFKGQTADFFVDLFNELYSDENYEHRLQKPTRHFIRSRFFDIFNRRLREPEHIDEFRALHKKFETIDRHWYELRIYELELLLYIIKSRGLFHQLMATSYPRIHQGFHRCCELQRGANREGYELDYDEESEPIGPPDLRPFEALDRALNRDRAAQKGPRLVEHSPVVDEHQMKCLHEEWCYLLLPAYGASSRRTFDDMREALFNDIARTFCEPLRCKLVGKSKGEFDGEVSKRIDKFEEELRTNMEELYSDYDVDVVRQDSKTLLRFRECVPIESRRDLITFTEMLLNDEWDRLRTMSLTADWFTPETTKTGRQIDMITDLDLLIDKYSTEGVNVKAASMLIYHHMVKRIADVLNNLKSSDGVTLTLNVHPDLQHHTTIITKKDDEREETPLKAIYFDRPRKKAHISPVYVEGTRDIQVLINYFDEIFDNKTRKLTWFKDSERSGRLFVARSSNKGLVVDVLQDRGDLTTALLETLKTFGLCFDSIETKIEDDVKIETFAVT